MGIVVSLTAIGRIISPLWRKYKKLLHAILE